MGRLSQNSDVSAGQNLREQMTKPRLPGRWRFAIFLAVVGGVIWWFSQGNICGLPIKYRLGHVDERFGLTHAEVLTVIEQAEQWWEEDVGANLFEYDPTANYAVTVNLIFDDRQQAVLELQDLQADRQDLEGELTELLDEYRELRDLFDRQGELVNQMHANYTQRLQTFERTVEIWNRRGGAPPDVYDELQTEQAQLEKQVNELNSLIAKQNDLADRINELAEAENQTVQGFNQEVKQFNEVYATEEGTVEEQVIYGSSTINIYQFEDRKDLVELLAHEMGHALGLNHTYDEGDLMYPKKIERPEGEDIRISQRSINDLTERCNLQ